MGRSNPLEDLTSNQFSSMATDLGSGSIGGIGSYKGNSDNFLNHSELDLGHGYQSDQANSDPLAAFVQGDAAALSGSDPFAVLESYGSNDADVMKEFDDLAQGDAYCPCPEGDANHTTSYHSSDLSSDSVATSSDPFAVLESYGSNDADVMKEFDDLAQGDAYCPCPEGDANHTTSYHSSDLGSDSVATSSDPFSILESYGSSDFDTDVMKEFDDLAQSDAYCPCPEGTADHTTSYHSSDSGSNVSSTSASVSGLESFSAGDSYTASTDASVELEHKIKSYDSQTSQSKKSAEEKSETSTEYKTDTNQNNDRNILQTIASSLMDLADKYSVEMEETNTESSAAYDSGANNLESKSTSTTVTNSGVLNEMSDQNSQTLSVEYKVSDVTVESPNNVSSAVTTLDDAVVKYSTNENITSTSSQTSMSVPEAQYSVQTTDTVTTTQPDVTSTLIQYVSENHSELNEQKEANATTTSIASEATGLETAVIKYDSTNNSTVSTEMKNEGVASNENFDSQTSVTNSVEEIIGQYATQTEQTSTNQATTQQDQASQTYNHSQAETTNTSVQTSDVNVTQSNLETYVANTNQEENHTTTQTEHNSNQSMYTTNDAVKETSLAQETSSESLVEKTASQEVTYQADHAQKSDTSSNEDAEVPDQKYSSEVDQAILETNIEDNSVEIQYRRNSDEVNQQPSVIIPDGNDLDRLIAMYSVQDTSESNNVTYITKNQSSQGSNEVYRAEATISGENVTYATESHSIVQYQGKKKSSSTSVSDDSDEDEDDETDNKKKDVKKKTKENKKKTKSEPKKKSPLKKEMVQREKKTKSKKAKKKTTTQKSNQKTDSQKKKGTKRKSVRKTKKLSEDK